MSDIDPVKFGRMLEALERLSPQLDSLEEQLQSMDKRMSELEGRYRIGKGVAFGIVVGLGFAAYGVKETLLKLAGVGG